MICATFTATIVVVEGSALHLNRPYVTSDASRAPSLWKSCRDKDEQVLPKVDIRKLHTTLSDLVSYRDTRY